MSSAEPPVGRRVAVAVAFSASLLLAPLGWSASVHAQSASVQRRPRAHVERRYAGEYDYDASRADDVAAQVRAMTRRYLERLDPLTRMMIENRLEGPDLLDGLPIPRRIGIGIDGTEITTRFDLPDGQRRSAVSEAGRPTPYEIPDRDERTTVTQLFRDGHLERIFGDGEPQTRYYEVYELEASGRRLSVRFVLPRLEDGSRPQLVVYYVRAGR